MKRPTEVFRSLSKKAEVHGNPPVQAELGDF